MRLTDILLEPVSTLMVMMKSEGSKFDAAARRLEAKALLVCTRRLPATCFSGSQAQVTLIEALRGSVGFEAGAQQRRRVVRVTEAFSELAVPA